MLATIDKNQIGYTLASVSAVDNRVQKDRQQEIDDFLDAIVKLRGYLDERSNKLEELEEKIRLLSWIDRTTLEDDDLFALKVLFDVADRLVVNLKAFEEFLNPVQQTGILEESVNRYWEIVDSFEEICQDVYNAFFVFPKHSSFQKTDDELKAIFG